MHENSPPRGGNWTLNNRSKSNVFESSHRIGPRSAKGPTKSRIDKRQQLYRVVVEIVDHNVWSYRRIYFVEKVRIVSFLHDVPILISQIFLPFHHSVKGYCVGGGGDAELIPRFPCEIYNDL